MSYTDSMNLPPLRSNKACKNFLGMCSSIVASLSLVKPHVLAGMGPNYTQYINIVNMKRCVMMLMSSQDEESPDQLFQNHQGGLAALDLLDLWIFTDLSHSSCYCLHIGIKVSTCTTEKNVSVNKKRPIRMSSFFLCFKNVADLLKSHRYYPVSYNGS